MMLLRRFDFLLLLISFTSFASTFVLFEETSICAANPFVRISKNETDLECTNLYHVLSIPGKGLGVVATVSIPRGTKIIIESPLVSISLPTMVDGQGLPLTNMLDNIQAAFDLLSTSEQQTYLSLHDHRFPGEEFQSSLLTILRSNGYNTGDDHVGMFPKIARINHSCRPNAGNFWSVKTAKRVIYAFRDIEVGEEITVAYIPLLASTKKRNSKLGQYGFVCTCDACTSSHSDATRRKIEIGIETLERNAMIKNIKPTTARKMAEKAEQVANLVEGEELGDYMAKIYHLAAIFHERLKDIQTAKSWSEKELDVYQLAEADSAEALGAMEYIDDLTMAEIAQYLPPKKDL